MFISLFNGQPTIINVLSGISIFIFWSRQLYEELKPNVPIDINKIEPIDTTNPIKTFETYSNMISEKVQTIISKFTLTHYVYIFVLYVIKFIIAFFSVNIGAFIVLLYFWLHSLFGIIIYFDKNQWFRELKSLFSSDMSSEIEKRCKAEILKYSDPCIETFFDKIIKMVINLINEKSYTVFFLLLLFLIIIYISVYMSINIVMALLSLFFIFIILGIIINIYVWCYRYYKNRW
jgi:hypothetical protein